MTKDLIAEYYSIREALADELYQLNNQISSMVVRRDTIQVVFEDVAVPDVTEPPLKVAKKTAAKKAVAKKRTPPNRTAEQKLLIFIKNHGDEGVQRSQINELFGDGLTWNELDNLIKRLRSAGLIVSEGKSRAAKWFITEK